MQYRIIIRNMLKGIGILGIILFLLGSPRSYYLLIGTVVALFLSITDFGRQCPLILSVQHHLNRMKSKRQSQIL
jgi:Sec-independent protein secretion pathway component TatC